MKIALVQTNPTVGAIVENADRILAGIHAARARGAELAVFSELVLPGYPPMDLLERPPFVAACEREEARIVREVPEGIHAIFGNIARRTDPELPGRGLKNTAVTVRRGAIVARAAKVLLPVYDVFDEPRYFEPGQCSEHNLVAIGGVPIGVSICEDLWNDKDLWAARLYEADPVERLAAAGARIIVNLSASPWSHGKEAVRRKIVGHAAARHGVWVVYVNQVGGNDGLLFDGNSIAARPDGGIRARSAAFAEDLIVIDTASDAGAGAGLIEEVDQCGAIHDALVMGIRDYFRKLGFTRAIVALSGGIDSAVTCALAVRALGPDAVHGIAMPSRFSSAGSIEDASALAANLGIRIDVIPIEPMFRAYLDALAKPLEGRPWDVTEENLQSRIRGALVMAFSNKTGAVVLTTGNKSEAAVGYCTLYGDTCGGLAPIADLYKRQVYAVARFVNKDRPVIPESSIAKPPSAELRPNQKDEDSLPPYDVLDEVLRLLIEQRKTVEAAAEQLGQPIALVRDIAGKLAAAEYKRKQFPPALRVSDKAWVGRSYPIAQRFRE